MFQSIEVECDFMKLDTHTTQRIIVTLTCSYSYEVSYKLWEYRDTAKYFFIVILYFY